MVDSQRLRGDGWRMVSRFDCADGYGACDVVDGRRMKTTACLYGGDCRNCAYGKPYKWRADEYVCSLGLRVPPLKKKTRKRAKVSTAKKLKKKSGKTPNKQTALEVGKKQKKNELDGERGSALEFEFEEQKNPKKEGQ